MSPSRGGLGLAVRWIGSCCASGRGIQTVSIFRSLVDDHEVKLMMEGPGEDGVMCPFQNAELQSEGSICPFGVIQLQHDLHQIT